MRIANPRDFWAGLAFGGFGLFMAVYAVMNYKYGTAIRMGPGYFPTWVGGMVAVLGLILALSSLRVAGPKLPAWHWRPTLFVLGSAVAYGYMLKPLGLVMATVITVFITAAGGYEFRWREALLLSVALAIFSVLVFVYALGLPFALWPEALE